MNRWQAKFSPLLALGFLLALISVTASAQVTTADLVGTVRDNTGAVVRGGTNIFPGFDSSCGSNARRSRSMKSISAGPNISGRYSRFSIPIPCSPVRLPPISTQR